MGTKKSNLSEALFCKTQRGVIGLLFGNPRRSFYANEIVRHAKAGIGAVQRELARLTAAGLLTVSRVGNQKHYQANPETPIFDELEAIVVNKRVAGEVPRRQLAAFCRRHHIGRLGIFGSAARGEAGDGSDIDLLVEFKAGAPASLFDMVRMQDELSRLFGRKVDLATSAVLENPYRRRTILKDLRELYAG